MTGIGPAGLVLEAAVSAGADATVTFNIRDYQPVSRLFGIEILTPSQIIKRLL